MSKRILVVLAHPDDETFIFGGTLAKYGARGAQITLVCATKGEMGRRLGIPPVATRESLPVLREQELREACAALGIEDLRFLGLRDKTLDYYDPGELAAMIIPIMRELQPAVVITFHEQLGGHPDHCAIGRAATLAHREAGGGSRLYFCYWKGDLDRLDQVGFDRRAVTAVPIDEAAAKAKLLAFRAHRTQSETMTWLQDERKALKRLAEKEYFLQGSGPLRLKESELLS